MIKQNNILNNPNIKVISKLGNFTVLEHQKDLSVNPATVVENYFASKMNVRRRQVMIDLEKENCILQAGAMQYMLGDLQMSSGVKGIGNFLGKMASAAVTKESAVKPEYSGTGTILLEPTTKYILLVEVSQWGHLVLEDGMFLASSGTVQQKVVARSNVSSALLGGEGLFNLSLTGQGIAALESPVPMEELIVVTLDNDQMKIDGNMAVAWSGSLDFTVEKSAKGLIGSAVSGEGFVNVYRGSGKILLAPTINERKAGQTSDSDSDNAESQSKSSKIGNVLDGVSNVLDIFS
ncbi:MAG: AIM24 family protein [Eubacterium sp.]